MLLRTENSFSQNDEITGTMLQLYAMADHGHRRVAHT